MNGPASALFELRVWHLYHCARTFAWPAVFFFPWSKTRTAGFRIDLFRQFVTSWVGGFRAFGFRAFCGRVFVSLHALLAQSPECDKKRKKRSTPHVVNQAFGLRILRHFRDFVFTYWLSGNSKDLWQTYYLLGDLGYIHAMILDLS